LIKMTYKQKIDSQKEGSPIKKNTDIWGLQFSNGEGTSFFSFRDVLELLGVLFSFTLLP
jgi:hypothetical protein